MPHKDALASEVRQPVPRAIHGRIGWLACILAIGSTGCGDTPATQDMPPATSSYVALQPEAALNRVALALTGTRPTPEDLAAVRDDPAQLSQLSQRYVDSPAFGETVKDMYAEILLMRSTELALPDIGLLDGQSRAAIRSTLSEEPLNLIREVVTTDAPFTEIVTADWTMLEPLGAVMWAGHAYDDGEGGLQRVRFTDDRPAAGILSTGPFLVRHESNGANYHRGRANIVSDVLLCEPFGGRDIPITGEVDLSDDDKVAEALLQNEQCVACHQVVDPLAQHFWGYRSRLTSFQILRGHGPQGNCSDQFPCYPVPIYRSFRESEQPPWDVLGLRGPNYWGAQTTTLTDMGREIAADPRFARCAVQQFAAYLSQNPRVSLDPDFIARHQVAFVESGYSAKALARSIVLDEWFLASARADAAPAQTPEVPGVQIMRPEQYERFLEALTDFRLVYDIPQNNHGQIRVMLDDVIGFRAMAGGVDGESVTQPVHTVTPVRLLVFAAYAEEAAGYVVEADLQAEAGQRQLLTLVDPEDQDEDAVRAQLVDLHTRIYGRVTAPGAEEITDLFNLWSTSAAEGDAANGWKSVLTAMFQSPDAIFY